MGDTSKKNINDDTNVLIHNNNHKILEHLEKIQGMLGDIHDYDIALDYLRQYQASNNPLITSTIANVTKDERQNLMISLITANLQEHLL